MEIGSFVTEIPWYVGMEICGRGPFERRDGAKGLGLFCMAMSVKNKDHILWCFRRNSNGS